ncbi:MAG: hemolysin family protein [Gemmatimonadota bacterium]|jgi:putative hemolysin
MNIFAAILLEVTILLVLILANGLLAGAEISVVASRKARLNQWAKGGDRAAAKALDLANSPNRFLSTVQIGITTIAVVAGAFGGTSLAGTLAPVLESLGLPGGVADQLALVLVVMVVTFVTLVLGELVPKRIALQNPEQMATRVAGLMSRLSILATPLVQILSRSTDVALRFMPIKDSEEPEITEEEIRALIAHATEAGVLEATEQQIVERLFRLSDMTIGMLMTPRDRIVWLDRSTGPESWRSRLGDVQFTRYPVADGALDQIAGYVKVQDLLELALAPEPGPLDSVLRKPHLLPAWTPVFRLLELFQWSHVHMALVTDDEDRVLGIVTLYDVLEGIVGQLPETREGVAPGIARRTDGSWLVDGLLPFQEFVASFGLDVAEPRQYPTLHAFILEALEGQPEVTSTLQWRGLHLEVVDMDGSRVDKVLVRRDADETRPAPNR